MDFHDQQTIWIAYAVSNFIGVIFLLVSLKRPKAARLLFALLFGWAAYTNYSISHNNPQVYLDYAEKASWFYADFINGWFKDHITAFITCIALGQLLIAVGMLLKGIWVKLACTGVIIFLIAIAPLGMYAAFPFALTVSSAAVIILVKDDKAFLWKVVKGNPAPIK